MPEIDNISNNENKRKQQIVTFLRDNRLSLVLAVLGLVLVAFGGLVMIREGSVFNSRPEEKIVIEEDQAETKTIKVDIQGAVLKPGVYELSFGSRVADLLIAAGGLSKKADRDWVAQNLNQAAKLKDGEKYYIPQKSESEVKGTQFSASGKININTASLSELDSLPGIGSVRGQKIIDGRPYARIEELLEKEVLPSSVFERIKDKISVY